MVNTGSNSKANAISLESVVFGDYIIATGCTVRQAAKHFQKSKSNIHTKVTEVLLIENPAKAKEVRKILDYNKSQATIRGGMATKKRSLRK